MSDLLSGIPASIIGSVCGAVVSVLLTLYLTRKSRRHAPTSGPTRQEVTITIRIVEEKAQQARAARSARSRSPSTQAPNDTDDTVGLLLLAFVVMVAVVAGYLQVKDTALLVVNIVTSFSLAAALVGLVTAVALRVPFGPGVKVQVIVNAVLGVSGLVGIHFTSSPLFVPDRMDLGPIMALGSKATISALISDFSPEVVAYVFTQIFGLACLVVGMGFVVLHSTKLYATQRVVVVASNNPSATARVSRWILRIGLAPLLCFRAGVYFSIVSLTLVSGALFTFLVWLPQVISAALA